MKKLLIPFFIMYSLCGFSSDFVLDTKNYKYKKLGSFYYVHESKPTLQFKLRSSEQEKQLNKACKIIYKKMNRYRSHIRNCVKLPSGPRCESLQTIFNDIDNNWSINFGEINFEWELITKDSISQKDELQSIAAELNTHKKYIKFLKNADILNDVNITSVETIEVPKELQWLNKLLEINSTNLFETDFYNKTVLSNGRIASCFLIKNSVELKISLNNSFIHNEKQTKQFIKKSFLIYMDLKSSDTKRKASKLIQAAYIGFHLGKLIEKNNIQTSISDLFKKFVMYKEDILHLHNYSTLEDFSERAYPREYFEYKMNISPTIGIIQ